MLSVRIGRLVVRSRRRHFMWLPRAYKSPLHAYLVESLDESDGNVAQLGGFTTLEAAEACIAALESEGWSDLHINHVAIFERLDDWQWNR